MTAKDAVKFAGLADTRCWYLAVRASCEPALIDWLEETLRGSSSH
ncbi:MAG: tetraacyldisaccharide 4'-kinase, partial [Burkholderiaceae bacterium]|nr:tetraacyldisaccharide 4'-kinase [Burkholderiaceae bacterium]